MKKFLFSPNGVWVDGLAIIRVITGILLIVHSNQMYNTEEMAGNTQWLADLHFPMPEVMAYAGKIAELIAGVFYVLGLFTRIASVLTIITFFMITVFLGDSKILTDAQHPFLFLMLGFIFLFHGAGRWSLDGYLFKGQ